MSGRHKDRPRAPLNRERQSVATRFIGDSEIGAGASPFRAVRRDAAATGAKVREQMRELVAQSAVDFGGAVRRRAGDLTARGRA